MLRYAFENMNISLVQNFWQKNWNTHRHTRYSQTVIFYAFWFNARMSFVWKTKPTLLISYDIWELCSIISEVNVWETGEVAVLCILGKTRGQYEVKRYELAHMQKKKVKTVTNTYRNILNDNYLLLLFCKEKSVFWAARVIHKNIIEKHLWTKWRNAIIARL